MEEEVSGWGGQKQRAEAVKERRREADKSGAVSVGIRTLGVLLIETPAVDKRKTDLFFTVRV